MVLPCVLVCVPASSAISVSVMENLLNSISLGQRIQTYRQICCAEEKFDKFGARSEHLPSNP